MSINAAVGHLARRGLQHAQQHFQPTAEITASSVDAPEHGSEPKLDMKLGEMLPILITDLIALLLVASIRYTVGEVVASLAMIESPSSTATIQLSKVAPPEYSEEPYADEPDAPLDQKTNEKQELLPSEAMAREHRDEDVEIMVTNNKPITAKMFQSISLLKRVGGSRGRWRGLGVSAVYHFLHGMLTNVFASFLGFGIIGNALCYIFVSLILMRVHMLWTHSMIAYPSQKSFFMRFVPRKESRALFLPTLVHAAAQQATFILPIAVAFAVGMPFGPQFTPEDGAPAPHHGGHHGHGEHPHKQGCAMMLAGLRFLAVPATALFVALAILLPAAVTLTRVEAALLPEGEETIVPFDREAIVSDIDLTTRAGSRALFVQAWRSFDRSARLRLVKLYVKMVMVQVSIVVVALHLMVAEVFLIGGERLAELGRAAAEQMKVMSVEAHKQQGPQ
ncbi:hypothetical protein B0A50_00330 [Salinomyces thailandicus]|uniref:Uncharacterized protein n=1 Tax=Salinomyces thailandicus TaxID=706561 RepID=A0A4V5N6B4_9PEZI|nr:hypothetical protein B0A50_00330 [Salinomyces thailandica]